MSTSNKKEICKFTWPGDRWKAALGQSKGNASNQGKEKAFLHESAHPLQSGLEPISQSPIVLFPSWSGSDQGLDQGKLAGQPLAVSSYQQAYPQSTNLGRVS